MQRQNKGTTDAAILGPAILSWGPAICKKMKIFKQLEACAYPYPIPANLSHRVSCGQE